MSRKNDAALLRAAGHEDAARILEAMHAGEAPEQAQEAPQQPEQPAESPDQAAARQFLAQIQEKENRWFSIPFMDDHGRMR